MTFLSHGAMDEMREIVSEKMVNQAMLVIAIVAPILGALIGLVVGMARKRLVEVARGLMVGSLGTVAWGMWHAYNAVTARFGLDTVKNLGINAAMFITAGIVIGWGFGYLWKTIRNYSRAR